MDALDDITGSVIVYSRANCTHSLKAKLLLADLGIPHLDISLDAFPQIDAQLEALVGGTFVTPQIFFNNIRVPGYESLRRLVATPELWQEVLDMLTDQDNNSQWSGDDIDDIIPLEQDKMLHMMRKANLIRERPGGVLGHRNSMKGQDFVNWLIKEKQVKRSDALVLGQKLIDKHFGHQLKEHATFNPDKFYQMPEDDPNMPLNLTTRELPRTPMNVDEFNERFCMIVDRIYEHILSDNMIDVFYDRLDVCTAFDDYKDFIPLLASLDLSDSTAEERIALFINIYNMMLIHIVYKYGPHSNIWQKRKYFNNTYYLIDHQRYSLQSIYNGVLRGNRKGPEMLWKPFGKADPRRRIIIKNGEPLTHFGLNQYRSHGTPLRTYRSNTVITDLRKNAQAFLSSSENFKLDVKKQVVSISPLFKQYSIDFGNLPEHAVEFLIEFVMEDGLERDVLIKMFETNQYTVNFLEPSTETNFVKEEKVK
ncbi:unnamed protein product [Bursaphelenchus xylophilus]|uniref:(pine wood nematode) hypothetical protein n=1 Tax=Bursaphelenchus xylophilus TaxID=6326 RepID=A0A1I7S3P6_BURXY|nr:unnamed protein product [Bursaphelenchus xylophilus]CAG9116448.1 unnamed protein product [Bursaphelenchus xylophilus]